MPEPSPSATGDPTGAMQGPASGSAGSRSTCTYLLVLVPEVDVNLISCLLRMYFKVPVPNPVPKVHLYVDDP